MAYNQARDKGLLGSSNSYFNERDRNFDGRLDYGEMSRGRGGATRSAFDHADSNSDGYLSPEEGRVYLQKAREAEAYAASMRREAESMAAQRSKYFFLLCYELFLLRKKCSNLCFVSTIFSIIL